MAILYGTQSNGETLPVQVNEFGQLVAKGIEGSPGQPGQQGEQGEPGQQGPPGPPGEGVPEPYGAEGTYLRIQSGVPTWAEGPPDPVPATAVLTDNIDKSVGEWRKYLNDEGLPESPKSGYDAWIRMQNYFDTPVLAREGLGVITNTSMDWYEFDITGSSGNIFEVTMALNIKASTSSGGVDVSLQSNNADLQGINSSERIAAQNGYVKSLQKFQYIVTSNELKNVRLTWTTTPSVIGDTSTYALLQSYKVITSSFYALRELKELRAVMAAKRD